ncbi:hypothetical protein ACFW1A_09425 [Kitasatospora sp. NPDC058965]
MRRQTWIKAAVAATLGAAALLGLGAAPASAAATPNVACVTRECAWIW